MAKNNFKPFATAANANVTAQADWEALPALLSGFMAGKASSAQVNKAIRQASFIAAALAQYTANKSGLDVLDDGDLNGFISKMGTAFGKDFQALDATLTALAGLATGANKLPYFTGNDTAALTDLTQVGRDIIGKSTIADILTYLGIPTALALLAPLDSPSLTGTPTVPNATQDQLDFRIANTAFVGQAIAELKGGVPAALNTLKKIADALALKAPLDSPDLTGTPTTTTANINQLDKRLASTEFVSLFVTHNNNQLFPVRTMTGNDSIRIPDIDGGIIFQWLTLSASAFPAFDTDVPVTLPRAFPNQHLIALAVSVNASASTTSDGLPQISGRDRGSVTVKQAITVQTQTLSDVAILCIGF